MMGAEEPGLSDSDIQAEGEIDSIIPRDAFLGLGPIVQPRSYPEQLLVTIWERILKLAPIGIEDHWFDLGGDSLGAVLLFGEIEARFGKALPLASLLETDTIAKL